MDKLQEIRTAVERGVDEPDLYFITHSRGYILYLLSRLEIAEAAHIRLADEVESLKGYRQAVEKVDADRAVSLEGIQRAYDECHEKNLAELKTACEELQREKERCDAHIDQLRQVCGERDRETARADALKNRFECARDMCEGTYWFWQGDDEDHLESLTCPVVIKPHILKGAIDQLAAETTRADESQRAFRGSVKSHAAALDMIVDLERRVNALTNDRDTAVCEKLGLKADLADGNLAFEHANEVIGNLERDLAEAKKELAQVRAGAAEYIKGTDPLLDKLEQHSDDLTMARRDLAEAKAEVERIRHNASHLRCELHKADASNAWGCPGCVEELRNENKGLREGLERLEVDLKEAKKKLYDAKLLLITAIDAAESSEPEMGDFRKLYLNSAWIKEAERIADWQDDAALLGEKA